MSKPNLENKVQLYINNLHGQGIRGLAGEPNGMSSYNEEDITGLLLAATIPYRLPELNQVFDKTELLDKLRAFMKTADQMDASDLINYMIEKTVDFYRPVIKELMDETNARSIEVASS